MAFFKRWVEEVKATVPADRLLVFEVKEGWGPLCQFLEVPEPTIPFPRLNDTASIKKKFKALNILSHLFVLGIPVAMAAAWCML